MLFNSIYGIFILEHLIQYLIISYIIVIFVNQMAYYIKSHLFKYLSNRLNVLKYSQVLNQKYLTINLLINSKIIRNSSNFTSSELLEKYNTQFKGLFIYIINNFL